MNLAAAILQFHQTISPLILLALLVLALILFVIMSLIFVFHWKKYGNDDFLTLQLQTVYFLGAALFISLALIAIIFYWYNAYDES